MSAFEFLLRVLLQGRLNALRALGREDVARLKIGTRRALMVNSPELIEEVLVHRTDEFQKGPALRIYSKPLLGDGLLTSEGPEHRKRRRLVAPAFAHQRVPRYADVMADLTRQACEAWPREGVLSMDREMTRLTLAIVGRTLFDVDLADGADEIGRHITDLIRYATDQTRAFRPRPMDKDTPRNRKTTASIDRLNQMMFGMIEARRRTGEDKGDLLSMLLLSRDEDGNSLNDQQVRDEAMTLFVAGHETTANATTWSLYLLSRNPKVQQALRAQVVEAVGRRQLKYEDLPRIPLALRIFKEALRLYPPAFIVVRDALHDMELTGGVRVAKGELVAMCEWVMHRRPQYFPDPDRFDPDRFLPENEARIPKYAYFPFGAGRRICIGNQFALMEGQIILATVAQHATVSAVSDRELDGEPLMTLRPKTSARLRVSRPQ